MDRVKPDVIMPKHTRRHCKWLFIYLYRSVDEKISKLCRDARHSVFLWKRSWKARLTIYLNFQIRFRGFQRSSLDRTAKSFGPFVVLSINDSLIRLCLFFSARISTQQLKIKSSLKVVKRPSITWMEITPVRFPPNFSWPSVCFQQTHCA